MRGDWMIITFFALIFTESIHNPINSNRIWLENEDNQLQLTSIRVVSVLKLKKRNQKQKEKEKEKHILL